VGFRYLCIDKLSYRQDEAPSSQINITDFMCHYNTVHDTEVQIRFPN